MRENMIFFVSKIKFWRTNTTSNWCPVYVVMLIILISKVRPVGLYLYEQFSFKISGHLCWRDVSARSCPLNYYGLMIYGWLLIFLIEALALSLLIRYVFWSIYSHVRHNGSYMIRKSCWLLEQLCYAIKIDKSFDCLRTTFIEIMV